MEEKNNSITVSWKAQGDYFKKEIILNAAERLHKEVTTVCVGGIYIDDGVY